MKISQSTLSFLESIETLSSLFKDPLFAAAILRMLDNPTTALVFDLLVSNRHVNTLKTLPGIKESLGTLLRLRLIRKEQTQIILNESFKESLHTAFCRNNFDLRFKKTPEDMKITPEKLSSVCEVKIRSILEFIVSDNSKDHMKSKEHLKFRDVLHYSSLIDHKDSITNKGFEFLLMSHTDQAWQLVVNSIKHFSQSPEDERVYLCDILEILMKKDIGPYHADAFVPWYLFLDSLGVIFITDKSSKGMEFYVCSSILLGSSLNELSRKFIILETNFKIYAYTNHSYEKNVLSLISKTVCVFPNLIKAHFSEDSLLSAFEKGITARQIIKYLQEYSHTVPKNIENQINIWEQKQHRIRLKRGYLYHDFIHLSDFQKVLKFIEQRNGLIFKDEQKRLIVGDEMIHEEVKGFMKEI